jgi:hypothetical protein
MNLPPGTSLNEAGYLLHGYQAVAAAPNVPAQGAPAAGSRWMSGVDGAWQQAQRQAVYPGQVLWQQAPAAVSVGAGDVRRGAHYATGGAQLGVGPVRIAQYAQYPGAQMAYPSSPRYSDTYLPRLEPVYSAQPGFAPPQPGALLPQQQPGLPTSMRDLVAKVTTLICSQALKSIVAGTDMVHVQMITLTKPLQEALAEAAAAINAACPHLADQLAFSPEARTITAQL